MNGKQKCRILRQIRREIAANNDIAYVTEDCKFKGDCRGTCPKCEAEVRYLEAELARRSSLGKRIAVAGLSLGAMISLTACNPVEAIIDMLPIPEPQIGDVMGVVGPEITQLDGEIIELDGDIVDVENDPLTECQTKDFNDKGAVAP